MDKKPTVKDIRELKEKFVNSAEFMKLHGALREDEAYFERDFADKLKLPKQFKDEATILPSARDIVLAAVDHTDIYNARVFVPQHPSFKGDSNAAKEYSEMLRKMWLGIISMTNTHADLSPWRTAATHFWELGLTIVNTLYDPHMWPDKPSRDKYNSEGEYNDAIDLWRSESHENLPIVIRPVNPINVLFDPSPGRPAVVMEKYNRMCIDIKQRWPDWGNPLSRKDFDDVEWISYWDGKYYSYLADDEPVLKTDVTAHGYGFCPYRLAFTGMGTVSSDNALSKKAVGLIRHLRDVLVSESRAYSIQDIVMKRAGWPVMFAEGDHAAELQNTSLDYGVMNKMPPGVTIKQLQLAVPPAELMMHYGMASQIIHQHAAPPSVMGLPTEKGMGFHRERILMQEAARKYSYGREAFRHLAEGVLIDAARIIKNVVPDDVRVWAQTPNDEFDIVVKKDQLKEPFVLSLEFSPVDELDEFQRHENLRANVQAGLMSPETAREKGLPNIDAESEAVKIAAYQLLQSPAVQQVIQMYAAQKLQEALVRKELQSQVTNED